mgnify:CR=1 FL=1|tara:strand:- start:3053 stop:3760 length:708 start_codon:yes stop_codon:yes gene_type:complete
MNNTQLQIKFKQRLNKLASNDFDNIECWQIVEAFNKAQIEWCRRQLRGTNQYKDGDEMSKRRVDDLQILLETTTLLGQDTPAYSSVTYNNFPEDYLEYKKITAYAKKDCCNEPHLMQVYLAEAANVNLIMRDPLKCPSYEWGETFATMQGNTIRVYYKDFSFITSQLQYYRKPRNIEIAGCTDPVDGGLSQQDVECEFKDDIAEIIIDEAVTVIAGDINDVNQYMRGSASAEKNN